jgi:tetratricopeptide (TPR) repeat protein
MNLVVTRRYMKGILIFVLSFGSNYSIAQHGHGGGDTANSNHISHIQRLRAETRYIHNLPIPKLIKGVGTSHMPIDTKSRVTQMYFDQGISLLHCFWDFEAYRSFKEAIRNDSSAIMPYWGLFQTLGPIEDSVYRRDKEICLKQLKALRITANEHERLYAETAIVSDSLGDKGYMESIKKLEVIVHKFSEDVNAKLFLALKKMSGFDQDMNPNEGQLYSEYLLRDVLRSDPKNHAANHYWIHLMEHCCPKQAIISAEILPSLAPSSGHIVHMPGHIYNRIGEYNKAHTAFIRALKVDSAYLKQQGIQEVDNWNYIHNINYLLANCVHTRKYSDALYYAEKLKRMSVSKNKKKVYEGTFFLQGILAPAKMEMTFGNWHRAASQFQLINNQDSVYNFTEMVYKDGLMFFVQGMDALDNDSVNLAISYSDKLDAILWRNEHQTSGDSVMRMWLKDHLNTTSLELQGSIESALGNYTKAIYILSKAQNKEKLLGYAEPPLYARPIAMSIGKAHERTRNFDQAIAVYEELLQQFPNSAFVYYALMNANKKKGDIQKAVEFENRIIKLTE